VSIAPEARGRGIVRSLVAACETEARCRGVRRMTLKTRLELPENERLFERFGFARQEVEAHPGFEAPTIAVMEKVLE
jgi:ribosomal protein S18 acetylase RimI-like enzyme